MSCGSERARDTCTRMNERRTIRKTDSCGRRGEARRRGGWHAARMNEETRTQLEAKAFRTLVAHLRKRTDVQNIDLMNLAGFCRNCLSKWLRAAAEEEGVPMSDDEAREAIYGMPYAEWKALYQK